MKKIGPLVSLCVFCVCFGYIGVAHESIFNATPRDFENPKFPAETEFLHVVHKVSVIETAIVPQRDSFVDIFPFGGSRFYGPGRFRHVEGFSNYRIRKQHDRDSICRFGRQFVNHHPASLQSFWKRWSSSVVNEFQILNPKILAGRALYRSTYASRNNGGREYSDNWSLDSYNSIGATMSSISCFLGSKPKENIKGGESKRDYRYEDRGIGTPFFICRLSVALICLVIAFFFSGWASRFYDKRPLFCALLVGVGFIVGLSGLLFYLFG